MDKLDIYKIWAPDESVWTSWAKPVLFASEPLNYLPGGTLILPDEMPWHGSVQYRTDTLIIADLPDKEGVLESLTLAGKGYRPVPLYNGVNAAADSYAPIVKTNDIAAALFDGAFMLREAVLHPDAPPVFLLDSNRMASSEPDRRGKFDNRWCIFPQDMPSASFLAEKRITSVVVRSSAIQYDLSHILYRYQEKGIEIHQCDGKDIRRITVHKPSRLRSLMYRYTTVFGFRRNAAGGFGGEVPVAEGRTGIG